MSNGVEFEEDKFGMVQKQAQQFSMPNQFGGPSTVGSSKMSQWLINKGIVKTDAGGQAVMIGLVVINIIVTIVVIKYFIL